MEKDKQELSNESRREALAKLAKLTAYTTPALVTLLTPQLSHAAASIPAGEAGVCLTSPSNKIGLHPGVVGANEGLNSQNSDSSKDCGA